MTIAVPAREHSGVDYPELAARTRRFSYGAPRAVTVAADGAHVVFLRSSGPEDPADLLWVFDVEAGEERLVADPAGLLAATDQPGDEMPPAERSLRERLRLSASGIGSYVTDPTGAAAIFTVAGRLFRAELRSGRVREVPTKGAVVDPRSDPAGQRIGYVSNGALHVTDHDGHDQVLAAEHGVTWGLAEFIAAEE
ncbi:MAG: dipeptidyl-peptidase 4, partial [Micromonosporaceae bacterium]|nr:dipeptidyl-peptidase 4 [Micromonosporaceae bacterium]